MTAPTARSSSLPDLSPYTTDDRDPSSNTDSTTFRTVTDTIVSTAPIESVETITERTTTLSVPITLESVDVTSDQKTTASCECSAPLPLTPNTSALIARKHDTDNLISPQDASGNLATTTMYPTSIQPGESISTSTPTSTTYLSAPPVAATTLTTLEVVSTSGISTTTTSTFTLTALHVSSEQPHSVHTPEASNTSGAAAAGATGMQAVVDTPGGIAVVVVVTVAVLAVLGGAVFYIYRRFKRDGSPRLRQWRTGLEHGHGGLGP
ncbi:hypothetical protein MMC15_004676 [Xylographa vitiligo]|nr:hypothetical protein [Xylographa vitiligo]